MVVLCIGNDAIMVNTNSQSGGSNQTSRITDRDGKGSIFSFCKAVFVERKWVHSASMMLITRLHVSPLLAFLEAGNWQPDVSSEEQSAKKKPEKVLQTIL